MNVQSNELRRVVVQICDGCLEHRPGQCNMPGCIFIRLDTDEIPDLSFQHEVIDSGPVDVPV